MGKVISAEYSSPKTVKADTPALGNNGGASPTINANYNIIIPNIIPTIVWPDAFYMRDVKIILILSNIIASHTTTHVIVQVKRLMTSPSSNNDVPFVVI